MTEASPAAALYTRPEAFQRERRSVFQSAWLLLSRASLLQKPGDWVAQTLGGWPVFAIASADGTPAAFRNVCRHQGLPLFDTGIGHCEQIRCRYHGWTYDSAGAFLTAPPAVAPPDPQDPMHRLERVAAASRHGLLFVHLGASPPPLGETRDPLADPELDRLGFVGEAVTDIDVNWKLAMEQALALPPAGVERRMQWPSLIVDVAAGGVVLHQVVPRAFLRTRIHHHCYGAADTAAVAAEAAALKRACLAAQTELQQGVAPVLPESPSLAEFRAGLLSSK
jgi:nitrite reductase/ring-hydroxylating ferredoxin subunit